MLSDHMQRVIGEKFVFVMGLSAMATLTRLPIGAVREAAAVGRAKGVDLPAEAAEDQLTFAGGLPHGMISCVLGDLNRGRRLELPWLSGAVVRPGEQFAIPAPANRLVYAALKLHADGRAADAPKPPT